MITLGGFEQKFAKLPQTRDSEVTFAVIESSKPPFTTSLTTQSRSVTRRGPGGQIPPVKILAPSVNFLAYLGTLTNK